MKEKFCSHSPHELLLHAFQRLEDIKETAPISIYKMKSIRSHVLLLWCSTFHSDSWWPVHCGCLYTTHSFMTTTEGSIQLRTVIFSQISQRSGWIAHLSLHTQLSKVSPSKGPLTLSKFMKNKQIKGSSKKKDSTGCWTDSNVTSTAFYPQKHPASLRLEATGAQCH